MSVRTMLSLAVTRESLIRSISFFFINTAQIKTRGQLKGLNEPWILNYIHFIATFYKSMYLLSSSS